MQKKISLDAAKLADLEPEKLLQEYATFKHYQLLGGCLGYNPAIAFQGTPLPLKDWNYDAVDEECRRGLDRWAVSKQAAPEVARQLLNAGTTLWSARIGYEQVLREVAEHLKLKCRGGSLHEWEQCIVAHLLQAALRSIRSLSTAEREKFDHELLGFLRERGVELGKQSPIDYLRAGGLAGVGALAGTQITTGIILSNLGVMHGLLYALGLWTVPAFIGPVIFAPLLGVALAYVMGKHNFKKTIPCVAILASLRQEEMLRTAAPAIV